MDLDRRRSRATLLRLHLATSLGALALVTCFLVASAAAELVGGQATLLAVKRGILALLLILVPLMAGAGLSGRRLAAGSRAPIVRRKLGRLKVVAATGVLVLIPCAITLERLAESGGLGVSFALLQALEFGAGTLNLVLLGLNFRDGLTLRARRLGARRAPNASGRI